MAAVSDEQLMAYVDGELPPARRAEIEQALAGDPRLQERVRQLRESGLLIRQAFDAPWRDEVPARLLAAIQDAPLDGAAGEEPRGTDPGAGKVLPFGAPVPSRTARPAAWGLGLAASIALAIGLLGGTQLDRLLDGPERGDGDRYASTLGAVPESVLQAALESGPSGVAVAWDQDGAGRGEIAPQLTFRAQDGRYCREYRVIAGASASALGLSCREAAGWRPVLAVAAAAQAGGGYAPASRASADALDIAVNDLMAGIPLSEAEEAALIEQGWQ